MDAKKYVTAFVGIIVLAAIVSAMAPTVLDNISDLNGTFAATGLGTLFSVGVAGVLLAIGIFWAVYTLVSKK